MDPTGREVRHSVFEEEIRRLPLLPCASFSGMPLAFREEQGILVPAGIAQQQHKRVAVLFSGGPAAGGHNVIVGLKQILHGCTLLGVREGFKGLLEGNIFEITDVTAIANTGGFDFLGTSRVKIKDKVNEAVAACRTHRIDALVIIGGDDSATNAHLLAPHLQTIAVPKTMDGDLQFGKHLPISFGFDTATRTYSELVGNILQDTRSSLKYWHFIKLMGRTASHVTLEVALQTKPTIALISEEVAQRQMRLSAIVDDIATTVVARSRAGMHHGAVLIPEGLLEFIPEMNQLIVELDDLLGRNRETLAQLSAQERTRFIMVNSPHATLLRSLPNYIQELLMAERDAHGNLTVSQLETDRLLAEMVERRVQELAPGTKFNVNHHFFGYEGRCGAPSAFDAMLGYNLGLVAGSLVLDNRTDYLAAITDFHQGGRALAIPLATMLSTEEREGEDETVVRKALVSLNDPAFQHFASRREQWKQEDRFSSPGPRQLWGPTAKQMPLSVVLNQGYETIFFK